MQIKEMFDCFFREQKNKSFTSATIIEFARKKQININDFLQEVDEQYLYGALVKYTKELISNLQEGGVQIQYWVYYPPINNTFSATLSGNSLDITRFFKLLPSNFSYKLYKISSEEFLITPFPIELASLVKKINKHERLKINFPNSSQKRTAKIILSSQMTATIKLEK